jgi:RES domain-containing protein
MAGRWLPGASVDQVAASCGRRLRPCECGCARHRVCEAESRQPHHDGSGRFNSPGRPVIYGALSFAGAMLGVLVHARIGKVPRHHVWVETDVPDDMEVERVEARELPPGWDGPDLRVARHFGDRRIAAGRSALLVVPSIIVRAESNVLVNPAHAAAMRPVVASPRPSRGIGGCPRLLNKLTC